MKPTSARECYWLNEIKCCKRRCINFRMRVWRRFAKRRLSKARRADARDEERAALGQAESVTEDDRQKMADGR